MKAKIIGTGMAVPPCVADNHLLARCMDTSDKWIVQRTGIKERRVSPDTYRMLCRLAEAEDKEAFLRDLYTRGLDGNINSSMMVSDLAFEASQMALQNAGVPIESIDLIIDSTTVSDYADPHTGCVLQGRFGLTSTPALNLQQGCAGFVYGLAVADQMIRTAMYDRVLNNLWKYGNTSAASVPICLHEAVVDGRVKEGDLLMLVAFGTGFSWGATLLRW